MNRYFAFLFLSLAIFPRPSVAQGPSADWRTLETEHFRVHFTAPTEDWARRAASRLESIRERVREEVGFDPQPTVDVLVIDPISRANGSAWPMLTWPRMLLYTTPPAPSSVIGFYRDWTELLLVHEDTHLVHLLRPSRNPRTRLLNRLVPFGPITQRAPRWVTEGYATLIEGRLTGSGRPNGDLRATILRRWAQNGELPSYGRLAGDRQGWLGMSMAYLVGSAYLEWLEERVGPDSLRHLWRRLTARQDRSFDAAFLGVFGDSPQKLYNRFRAELTYRAMGLEEQRASDIIDGTLWQDLSWTTGAPTLSADGQHLALVLRSREGSPRLVVWSTAEDQEALETWEKRRDEIAQRDPEDVLAVRHRPLPRKPVHQLVSHDSSNLFSPRFTPDGDLLHIRFVPDREGFLAPDLFRWQPGSGHVERLTHGAAVREADPAPNGTWAIAVRHRHGKSQLVSVDLVEGSVQELTPPSLESTWNQPRISPDGGHLAVVRHQQGAWGLWVHELRGREVVQPGVEMPLPAGATVAYPSWGAGGNLFATVGSGGFLDVHRWQGVEVTPQPARAVTRSQGAAMAAAPTPDGQGLFFLAMESDGFDLRFLDLQDQPELPLWVAEDSPGTAPAVRPPAPSPPSPFKAETLPESSAYGIGRLELLPLLGGIWSPGPKTLEAGLRFGDVVGRFDGLALLASSEGGSQGGALKLAWRGWPVDVTAHFFAVEERLSQQDTPPAVLDPDLDLETRGAEIRLDWLRIGRRGDLRLRTGFSLDEVDTSTKESLNRSLIFGGVGLRGRQALGPWRFDQALEAELHQGRTDGSNWQRHQVGLRLGLGHRDGSRLGLGWQRRGSEDVTQPFDRYRLGGLRGSLLPHSLQGGQIHVPALPSAFQVGDEYEGQRIELRWGSWPVTAFYERHRLWSDGFDRPDWLALRGLEIRLQRRPWPLLRLPALELRFGVAEILDGPLENEIEGWFGLRWEP